jgi:hypothetical protein
MHWVGSSRLHMYGCLPCLIAACVPANTTSWVACTHTIWVGAWVSVEDVPSTPSPETQQAAASPAHHHGLSSSSRIEQARLGQARHITSSVSGHVHSRATAATPPHGVHVLLDRKLQMSTGST